MCGLQLYPERVSWRVDPQPFAGRWHVIGLTAYLSMLALYAVLRQPLCPQRSGFRREVRGPFRSSSWGRGAHGSDVVGLIPGRVSAAVGGDMDVVVVVSGF